MEIYLVKILFCQLRNHGDIIRTFPLLDAIKSIHPHWFIGYTCYEGMEETCRLCSSIDAVFSQPRLSAIKDTNGGTRIFDCSALEDRVKVVRQYGFDVYVDLHGVFQSALFGGLCEIPKRIGRDAKTSKDGAFLFYTDLCHVGKNVNRMERHFSVIQDFFPEIQYELDSPSFQNGNELVTIFPGSSVMGRLKRWPLKRFIELSKLLDVKIQYVVGPEDDFIDDFDVQYSNITMVKVNSWKDVLEQVEKSSIVVGNDCAYLHLAIWKRKPVIMLFGPTSEVINGVWKYGLGKNISAHLDCRCEDVWKGTCSKNQDCMNAISVATVKKAIQEIRNQIDVVA